MGFSAPEPRNGSKDAKFTENQKTGPQKGSKGAKITENQKTGPQKGSKGAKITDNKRPDGVSDRSRGQKRPKLVSILGPTASGKSSVAMNLAGEFGFEIVNCDSRQIYREMAIGTAAPTKAERETIPHHLYDFVSPDRKFSAGDYSKYSRECLQNLWKEKRKPLLVGGTGFYYEALTRGLSDSETDPAVRSKIQERLDSDGLQALVDELQRLDPEAASRIETKNPRRVTRALEVIYQTGLTLRETMARQEGLDADRLTLVLSLPREILRQRIDSRINSMVSEGLEKEARLLLEKFGPVAPGMKSIGYSEWVPYFNGEINLEAVISEIKTHTSQYAKRQATWFRNRTQGIQVDLNSQYWETEIRKQIKEFCDLP